MEFNPLLRKARKLLRNPDRFFADMVRHRIIDTVNSELVHVEKAINKSLRGYNIVAIPDKMSARYLSRFRFDAKTIIDVGVSRGSDFLYEAFPAAKHVLIDPLPDFEATIRSKFQDLYRFEFHELALGSAPGVSVLHLQSDNISKSTLQRGTRLEGQNTFKEVSVKVDTLDRLLGSQNYERPFGLKLDTEGHELEVLRGASATLQSCAFVLAEVSIKRRYKNGYRFSEVVACMAENGFELLDILNPISRVHRFFDCLFVPSDSPLFSDRSI